LNLIKLTKITLKKGRRGEIFWPKPPSFYTIFSPLILFV